MQKKMLEVIDNLRHRKILILGDMVADVYLEGKISRISREAPVLILRHEGETVVPGGAANAVHNAVTLGGDVYAAGIVAADRAGERLRQVLNSKGVHIEGLIAEENRPTITKTRVMAGGMATVRQQVVRIDKESSEPIMEETERKLISFLDKTLPAMDAVVISDYGSGTVTYNIREYVIKECRQRDIPCMIDSRYDILNFPGVSYVKQNESEAVTALKISEVTEEALSKAGEELLERLKAKVVLITRGPDGMDLFTQGKVQHIPVTNISEVYDVTGAGDTVVVTMMLAVAAGAAPQTAAVLANIAAGVVVRKPGTATTDPDELKEAVRKHYENN